MIFYDMMLIAAVVLFDACALWLTVKAFKCPNRMSKLETAVIAFIFISCAITLSFYAAVSIIQTSETLSIIQSSRFNTSIL